MVEETLGTTSGVLDLPDHSTPFVVGEYQAYPGPAPKWNGDFDEEMYDANLPSERVLFEKLLNTRFPEDIDPSEYDEMVYQMEVLVRNSPYRPGVYQRSYSDRLRDRLSRPDYLSSVINQKTGALVSSLYSFATDYVPSLPNRFLTWTFETVPQRLASAKLSVEERFLPVARVSSPSLFQYVPRKTTAAEVARQYDLEGTTAVVTGASSGLGREVAKNLALRGATLIMPARDVPACDQLALQWRTELKNPAIHCAACDLSDMDSVSQFVRELKTRQIVPDLLVNAAAVLKPFYTLSNYGTAHTSMSVNLLSHMVLTDGIIELMEDDILRETSLPTVESSMESPSNTDTSNRWKRLLDAVAGDEPSTEHLTRPPRPKTKRIVNLTCSAYQQAALRGEELNASAIGGLWGMRAYNVSKLGNVAHAQQTALWLARNGHTEDIVINSIDPGLVHGTKLFENTFFKYWHTRLGALFGWNSVQGVETAAAPIMRLLLDPALTQANGLHFRGYDVAESPLARKSTAWITKFLMALDELKDSAIEASKQNFYFKLRHKDRKDAAELEPKMKELTSWYRKQSEEFEKSLELPMPQMVPMGHDALRPPPNQERIGSKPLGIGPHDAPLIGDDLRANWQYITDTYPVQIQELERRRELVAPPPTPEEAADIARTQAEFDELKRKILAERRLKSPITSQYSEPLPNASGETWWGWVKAKVDNLTKPTIHK